ncbi:unnamed protein product [Boreogadus saida]
MLSFRVYLFIEELVENQQNTARNHRAALKHPYAMKTFCCQERPSSINIFQIQCSHGIFFTPNCDSQSYYALGICPTDPAIENQIVDAHNAFRRAVQPSAANMLKMIWSNDVAALSQAWLDHCMLKHGPPSSRMLNGYELGENLFYSTSALDWATVITAWHNEVHHYTYPNGSENGESVGHYTQVVWNSSWQVGCGMTKCGSTYFYGCQYYRAGNYVGWPPYKEGTACDSCPNNCEDKLCTNPCQYINRFLNCPALKKEAGCGNHWVNLWCPAECKCPNEIIPVYRKK